MLKQLLSKLSPRPAPPPAGALAPYADSHANFLYNLLFCDEPALFARGAATNEPPWSTLFSDPPELAALTAIAGDAQQESRVRMLAFERLRAAGKPVPAKILLGVIVEVPLPGGLDVLAAYADGRVRYINQTGRVAVFEGAPPAVTDAGRALIAASEGLVRAIGPWDKPRLAPPRVGRIRLSFLVSDGLYFGEGDFEGMHKDVYGAPVVRKATELLHAVVATAPAPGA
ncbi:MAG TPA: hypothetical protein VF132_14880 [Rudaea sp.]